MEAGSEHATWDWRLTISSLLLYVLAFNLVFFLQELFLVIPKALTPGLYPTLFHNNHTWTGQNPLQNLLQGTGAVTVFAIGMLFAYVLQQSGERSKTRHLFIFWMACQGFFQSLPQVVIGAINPSNDVGMAMKYLELGRVGNVTAALCALGAIAAAGLWLGPQLLALAKSPTEVDNAWKRTVFLFRTATLPAFAGVILIIPFRMPRNFVELIVWPLIVGAFGASALQLSARRTGHVRQSGAQKPSSILLPLVAVLLLLLVFQLILRRGVRFY